MDPFDPIDKINPRHLARLYTHGLRPRSGTDPIQDREHGQPPFQRGGPASARARKDKQNNTIHPLLENPESEFAEVLNHEPVYICAYNHAELNPLRFFLGHYMNAITRTEEQLNATNISHFVPEFSEDPKTGYAAYQFKEDHHIPFTLVTTLPRHELHIGPVRVILLLPHIQEALTLDFFSNRDTLKGDTGTSGFREFLRNSDKDAGLWKLADWLRSWWESRAAHPLIMETVESLHRPEVMNRILPHCHLRPDREAMEMAWEKVAALFPPRRELGEILGYSGRRGDQPPPNSFLTADRDFVTIEMQRRLPPDLWDTLLEKNLWTP